MLNSRRETPPRLRRSTRSPSAIRDGYGAGNRRSSWPSRRFIGLLVSDTAGLLPHRPGRIDVDGVSATHRVLDRRQADTDLVAISPFCLLRTADPQKL